MKKNIGTADRIIRLVLGIISIAASIAAWFFTGSLLAVAVLVLFGLFCIYEAAAGWCALYAILGKNTCPVEIPDDL